MSIKFNNIVRNSHTFRCALNMLEETKTESLDRYNMNTRVAFTSQLVSSANWLVAGVRANSICAECSMRGGPSSVHCSEHCPFLSIIVKHVYHKNPTEQLRNKLGTPEPRLHSKRLVNKLSDNSGKRLRKWQDNFSFLRWQFLYSF